MFPASLISVLLANDLFLSSGWIVHLEKCILLELKLHAYRPVSQWVTCLFSSEKRSSGASPCITVQLTVSLVNLLYSMSLFLLQLLLVFFNSVQSCLLRPIPT